MQFASKAPPKLFEELPQSEPSGFGGVSCFFFYVFYLAGGFDGSEAGGSSFFLNDRLLGAGGLSSEIYDRCFDAGY